MLMFEFDTREFELTYGRAPKGRGWWWFSFEGYEFSTSGTYAEAKKACKAEIKRLAPDGYDGLVIVKVLT